MQQTKPQVILISRDPELDRIISGLVADGIACATARSSREAEDLILATDGKCVAVVDGDLPTEEAFQVYRLLHGAEAVPTLMLVTPGNYQQFALDPHRFALDEFVPKPVQIDEMILRVKAMMVRAGFEPPARTSTSTVSVPPPSEPVSDGQPEERDGKLVVIFSAKGGVGKSMIATNLAVGLVEFYGAKVLLVDADLWFGDIAVLMNLRSPRTLFDVTSTGMDPDSHTLQQIVTPHPSGLSVVLRPPDPAMVDRVDPSMVVKAVTVYRNLFDYVIVDTHPSFDEMNLQLLDAADRILVVSTPELSATANTSSFLQIADSLGYKNKVTIVLNRANSGIRMDALEGTLGMPVSASVVSAGRVVVEAGNEGASLFSHDPPMKEKVTRDLAQLVEIFAGKPRPSKKPGDKAPKSESGGLFAGFRRRPT
jgi:pilus assembly protein CpaE